MAGSITSEDVLRACSKLGVELSPSELPSYTSLLQTTNDAFLRLLAMPDYHPPTNTDIFPRKNVHKPSTSENVLGVAWAHTFSIGGAHTNSTGPLAGKTFCLKDNVCVMDVPQVNGTDIIEPYLPAADATVVTRILEAGGEIIGTATCENMSYSPSSNTSSTGVVENPHAEGYSAGGSSSGVGALVGSPQKYVDMGIGCDQGGSIRIPAAMCGAVGLKPTHGLVPYTGIVSSEFIMDHVGPICRDVWDTAVLLDVVAGRDSVDDRGIGAQRHGEISYSTDLKTWFDGKMKDGGLSKSLDGMKIGILKEAMEDMFLFPEMKEKVYSEAYRLRELGATVEEVSIPGHVTGRDIWMGIRRIGGCLSLQGMASGRKTYATTPFFEKMYPSTQDKWDRTPPAVKATLINGTAALEKYPGLYGKCLNMAIRCESPFVRRVMLARKEADCQ
jgi:amidase